MWSGNSILKARICLNWIQVCKILIESTKVIKGARVEHNKFCVTVHFRRVKEEVTWILSLPLPSSSDSCLCTSSQLWWWCTAYILVVLCSPSIKPCQPMLCLFMQFLLEIFFLEIILTFITFLTQHWKALAEKVDNVLKDFPTLNLTHGRKVLFLYSVPCVQLFAHSPIYPWKCYRCWQQLLTMLAVRSSIF